MISLKREALGSLLEMHIYEKIVKQADIDACFCRIEEFENTYSRFKEGNFLWKLNETGRAPLTAELSILIKLAQKVYRDTRGYFDITLLPLLENAGYGIYEKLLPEILGSENIILTQTEIELKNGVKIDLGSLGK
jgi:thiamine biosynthesis lipoprotein ApbE